MHPNGGREPTDESDETEETVEPQPDQTAQCTRELNRLRNSIRRLQQTYHQLKDNQVIVDLREFEVRKNRYEQRKRDLQAKLSGLESQLSSQSRSQISELKQKIKELEKQLNASVSELEQQRKQNADYFINLVATQIDGGKLAMAAQNFLYLMAYTNDPYGEIVKRVSYSRPMMTFLASVDFKYQPVAGYEALVDAMIERGTLRGYDALELLKHLQALILARDGKQQTRAIALMRKFQMNAQ
ncbi:hypothetical protein ZHAS_00017280 [Anopheles sinensis]|uniref:Uncharacterized protein n=1 Tax=Anopheles sinensis TaxID=74873 RepID=A0A084WFY2_ANOSI|nr:hypothetical protein ZHAS_00017280 [Anopheles sinensis]